MSLFSQQRQPAHFAPSQAEEAPPAGAGATTLFKRYRPLETLAQGGFGSVEICLDTRLQRRVAIKRIPLAAGGAGAANEATTMALAEARTASLLQHPNIVQVIDFTYDSAYAYLVMEYVDGMTLEQFLAGVQGHSLTFDEAACIADALVQALAYAHENGVLHLDIKPANVLIDRNGHVKLTDFGMATLTSAAGFGGARGGTVGYMPPEQLRGDAVDERSDIFSLACVLYEALCANAPFRAADPIDSLTLINRGVVYPAELLPDLPAGACDALVQALSPDSAERMASVGTFGSRFLARLGNAREGRKSLARVIARLVSDDPEATVQQEIPPEEPEPAWTRDPAEGLLGSRFPRARELAVGICGALGSAGALWWILGLAGVEAASTRGVAALAIGAAACAAPQLGSALTCAGVLVLGMCAQELFDALPTLIVLTALCVAWWYVWGRVEPASSAACSLLVALAGTTSSATLLAPLVAAGAGYFLSPVSTAVTTGFGIVLARLLLVFAQTGGLALEAVGAALLDAPFLLTAGATALAAALESHVLACGWRSWEQNSSTGLIVTGCLLPLLGVMVVLGFSEAMEITALDAAEIAGTMGWGILSTIICFVCVYMLGYRKDLGDGD